MVDIKCPICGCTKFYVKDPDDEYETCEFECKDGEIVFNPEIDKTEQPDIGNETRTFCDKCAWHGNFNELKKE
jgi:hypothetical protein